MHRAPVRASLRKRELLLSGPDSGGHPRGQPHHGSVHRLQVLPQALIPLYEAPGTMGASFSVELLDMGQKSRYDELGNL